MIEHCVSTFNAIQEDNAYKAYLAEILRGMSKQLGLEIKMSYFDIINSLKPEKEETRTADEVITGLKEKAAAIRGN